MTAMSPPSTDMSHLAALIDAARAEADRLGPAARDADAHLAAAARVIRPEPGQSPKEGGRPDEGIRLGDLTTDNDK